MAFYKENKMELSNEQKLLALMLCDIHEALNIKDSVNPEFIREAIMGGHDWALNWELEGQMIASEPISERVTGFVVDVLEMYSIIEGSYEQLSEDDKATIAEAAAPFGRDVSFRGFDGNNEGEYMSVSSFLVEKMGRFTEFEGRANKNSHSPMLGMYQRMLDVYKPMRAFPLTKEQIIEIELAKVHPANR